MANFTAGTSFSDGVTNDVTAAKLNALVADAVPTSSLSLNSTTGTIATFNSTTGTIPTLVATTLITTGTGTAAAPAIVPTGDTNTGIFFPAADTIAFSEGGAEAMRIDSSGNVGIGISPSQKLDVNGGSAIRGTLFIGDGSSSLIRKLTSSTPLTFANNAGSAEMTIDSSGNVGVGTASPTQKLDIQSAAASVQIKSTTATNSANLKIENNSTAYIGNESSSVNSLFLGTTAYATCLGNVAAYPVQLATNNNVRMTIDSSGNVGIGNTNPATALETASFGKGLAIGSTSDSANNITIVSSPTSTIAALKFGDGGSGVYDQGYLVYDHTNNSMLMGTNRAERIRIDTSGNVGIGETSIGGRLHIKGSTATSSSFSVFVTDSAGSTEFFVRDDGLIGTGVLANSPYNFTTANAANCNIGSNGFLARSTSSIKYKKDILNSTHGLTEVLKLRPVTYKGKSEHDGSKVFGGLIAEEVHDAGLTEFVQYAEDGSPDSLSYGNMVSLAFKAIQELKSENDSLKSRIEALEAA